MKHLLGNNLKQLRAGNLMTTLNVIREKGPIARVDICKISGFSSTTCTNTTKELLEHGFIKEKAIGVSTGGRKPILLELNAGKGYVIGIAIEKSRIFAALYNLKLEKKNEIEQNCSFRNQDLIKSIKQTVYDLLALQKIGLDCVYGVTLCVPGIVDTGKHKILASSSLATTDVIELYDDLHVNLEVPIHIMNDGMLMALAEKEFYYPEYHSLIYFFVDEGIGSGIILDNKIVSGAFNGAGEIGHTTIDKNGPVCFCGNRGCLEAMAGIPALLQRGRFGIESGHNTLLKELTGREPSGLQLQHIKRAAVAGDTFASHLIADEIENLYCGVVNIMNMYNPEIIVLGGQIMQLGDSIIQEIKKTLRRTIFHIHEADMILAYSKIGSEGKVSGAGIFAINEFFKNVEIFAQVLTQHKLPQPQTYPHAQMAAGRVGTQ